MPGYKKKPVKRAPKRRAPVRRARPMSDGQSIIVNAYFEAHKALDAVNEGAMAYSICIDPKEPKIIGATGVTFTDGGAGSGSAIASGSNLSFSKYTTFASLFNEYKVNSANIKIRTDATCGLENAVICTQDKGNSGTLASMAQSMNGAHKSFSMTTSRRELTYGCKNTGQDLDYRNTATAQVLTDGEKKYLKVFQKLPSGSGNCEHQIQVMLSLTLKDSKNLN